MPVLVVYYSRTGNTRRVAEAIADKLHADIEVLRDTDERRGVAGFLRSGFQVISGKRARLEPVTSDLLEYDLVVIGSPIWGSLSVPVRTYLEDHRGRFKRVGFFVTHGGSGEEKAFRVMRRLTGREPLATLEVKESELVSGAWAGKVSAFAGELDSVEVAP
jgi:flavodoxin